MSAPGPTVLGIDLGTSSVKVVLADRSGTVLRQSTQPYGVQRPRPGWAESDPEQWWDAIVTGVREVAADPQRPAPSGIGLSGQMHGVVVVDADGVPLRPAILWADSRAGEQLEIIRSLSPTVTDRLANPLSPGMAGPILGWLAEHEPVSVTCATAAVQPKDWVRARLTGRLASEPSDASATLLYDVIDQTWSAGVLEALRIPPALMPPILPSAAAVAGTLQASPAQQLGLPTGVPIAAGAADTAAAALGSGLVTPGDWQLTIGTGVQIITVVPPPTPQILTPIEQTVTHLYRSATAASGWYAMAASLTGGTTLDWVRRLLGASWADLYAAARHRPGAEDPIFLPHLMGERTPYLDTAMRGSWMFLGTGHTREHLLYAALEGVAFAVTDCLQALPSAPGGDGMLWLAGGGTIDPGWRQLLADVLQVGLRPIQAPNASARGAALLAAVAAGLSGDDDLNRATPHAAGHDVLPRVNPGLPDRRRRYQRALEAHRQLTSAS